MDFSDFFPVWKDLNKTERRLLESAATKGALVSDGKDTCSGIMLIESGQIRAYTTSPEGKELPFTGCWSAIFACFRLLA